MSKEISMSEVSQHKKKKSAWIVIHNNVYDVTGFLNEHPAGPEVLLEYAGQDGTQAFEDVGHSYDARDMLKKYKIGTLPTNEYAQHVECCSNMKWLLLALAAAVVVGVVLHRQLGK